MARKNPRLRGYSVSLEQGRQARDSQKLLNIRLETSLRCNMNCIYCCWATGEKQGVENSYSDLERVISQAADLGATSVVVVGGGEPTIYPNFRNLLIHMRASGMRPVVITNGLVIDEDWANFFSGQRCSIIMKRDAMSFDLQDKLCALPGTAERMDKALQNLMAAGLNDSKDPDWTSLGVAMVCSKVNMSEIPEVWRFARKNHIYPCLELLNPKGRAKTRLNEFALSGKESVELMNRLRTVDEEFGNRPEDWPELKDTKCLQHLHSFYVDVYGWVSPCGPVRSKNQNIREKDLYEIYHSDEFREYRAIEKHLDYEQPCLSQTRLE
ncbi:MAG: radical SAM protein [Syntrophaceae bacterium]|nr:radical SAM protein [Syntrophaceae bacterium]